MNKEVIQNHARCIAERLSVYLSGDKCDSTLITARAHAEKILRAIDDDYNFLANSRPCTENTETCTSCQ